MVRAIILGAGPAGERHGRALRALADRCLLAGVYDPDPEAAKTLAMTLGIPWLEALEPAFQEAHVAIVGGARRDCGRGWRAPRWRRAWTC